MEIALKEEPQIDPDQPLANGNHKPSELASMFTLLSKQISSRFDALSEQQSSVISSLQLKVEGFADLIERLKNTIAKLKNENFALKQQVHSNEQPVDHKKSEDPYDDYNEFQSVYESFKCRRCNEISKKYYEFVECNNSFSKKYSEMIESMSLAKARISENADNIKKVWHKLKKTREAASMVFEQNKVLKEALAKQRKEYKASEAVDLYMVCIEHEASKHKHRVLAEQIRNVKSSSILDFSDQPISDVDILQLSDSLLSMHATDCIKEIVITNGYASHMEGVISLIRQNSAVLRKLVINGTLLNGQSAIKILETLANENVKLEQLNLDNNSLASDDLVLLLKPFLSVNIKYFSIKGNEIRSKAIEKFCRATMYLKTLEEIDLGKIRVSEQKELEWRTDFKKLTFERIVISDIDYQYVT